jgi:hypothetical protein
MMETSSDYDAQEKPKASHQVEEHDHDDQQQQNYNFVERQAMHMARWPKTYFWVAFVVSFGLSVIGMVFGDFSVSTESNGWQSRGTLISDRQTQLLMTKRHENLLFEGDDEVWDDLINNVQPGWQDPEDERRRRRQLLAVGEADEASLAFVERITPTPGPQLVLYEFSNELSFSGPGSNMLSGFLERRLQEDVSSRLAGCDVEWYTDGRMANETRLWPVWKVKNGEENTALEPRILRELCLSEETTQRHLEEQGLCFGCEESDSGRCLPPHSIVLYARLMVPQGMDMDCENLANAWGPYQADTETEWKACVEYVKKNPKKGPEELLEYCPEYFYPSLLDELFDINGRVQYTSSIFATDEDMVDDLYDNIGPYGRGDELIEGAYDTQDNDFGIILADGAVGTDMLLATGSALITTVAILVHTRSPFLTLVGIVQIILSFPLAFFMYRFVLGFNFFPFLNFIGVFVVFALGADHVFVAVDKWKNARLGNPNGTTEQVAAKALPDAAAAMFLTTSTTAIAFFGTAICPVAPVRLFAIFCGLLVTFDYIMDVVLIFPCLCIYDGYRKQSNCCITMGCCQKSADGQDENALVDATSPEESSEEGSPGETKSGRTSLIRRILLAYYDLLHMARWPLLVASAIAFAVCCYYASTLSLPLSSDVRILKPSVEYERSYAWRQNLLLESLDKQAGSLGYVIWGVEPADTGDLSDPASWSTLVLDDTFDPSSQAAQVYLKDFCKNFFAEDFADPAASGYLCPINRFERWLQNQTAALAPDAAYAENCVGAAGLPMDSDAFHSCFVSWSQEVGEKSILARNGIVEIMSIPFNSRVRYDSPNSELDAEWHLIEDWMNQQPAPAEVSNAYFSSPDFWWYDTNTQMFRTAYGSAGIAIGASAIIILLSSRSLVMTLFSVLSIGYVLASVTSMMVSIGWTLGFLESICFAILIGVSVDFVIHFSHAYCHYPGKVSKEGRTKHALIDMGPSVLAAAFTTLAGAAIMLGCVITFFTKFALVLFFTIIQAIIGSFIVFLTLTDCIGPEDPTYMAERLVEQCSGESKSMVDSPSVEGGKDKEMAETARSSTIFNDPTAFLTVPDTEFEM